MNYYFTKVLKTDFDSAVAKITEELKKEGFGVITVIDLKDTFKKKLDLDFRRYKILGACNPAFASRAIEIEPHVGALLPCNVIVQEHSRNRVEISAVNPVVTMMAVKNAQLSELASEVQQKLKRVIEQVK